jgi:hypothetical protein
MSPSVRLSSFVRFLLITYLIIITLFPSIIIILYDYCFACICLLACLLAIAYLLSKNK